MSAFPTASKGSLYDQTPQVCRDAGVHDLRSHNAQLKLVPLLPSPDRWKTNQEEGNPITENYAKAVRGPAWARGTWH